MTYFNTTSQTGEALKEFTFITMTQEDQILHIWKSFPEAKFTACYFWKNYFSHVPLTSVRRAFTNLMNRGKLIKTNETRIGYYGRPAYEYKLK